MQKSANYWLMKSEPSVYSIDDFAKDKTALWEGVRNYQARNFMTKEMKVGDEILFYHSSCEVPGIYGVGQVSEPAQADPSAFNKKSEYFEPKATQAKPIWQCVQVKFVKKLKAPVALTDIKKVKELQKMVLLQKGSRLSIQPVKPEEFQYLMELAKA